MTASSVLTLWLLKFNDMSDFDEVASDPIAEDWEDSFISIILGDDQPEGKPASTELFGIAGKSYNDEIDNTLASNLAILFVGCILIFFYIAVVLGRLNSVEQRVMP